MTTLLNSNYFFCFWHETILGITSFENYNDTFSACGYTVPTGSGILVSIWGLHRDPKYWGPDAEQFDPDRFLPERFKLEHSCSYVPFSHGPRNCLGKENNPFTLRSDSKLTQKNLSTKLNLVAKALPRIHHHPTTFTKNT